MPQRRSKEYQDIYVQVQEQYEDEEKICQCFQNCKPPPPPGREDLWDLQFCRWWGWNWVRKREIEGEIKKGAPKKNFKELCDCLRFKKGDTEVSPLQNLYNTPSNSVVIQETNSHEVAKTKCDSFRNLEVQRNVSQKNERCNEERIKNVESWVKTRDELNSNEECYCSETEGYRSSTEESIEYIKIHCCPCHHKEKFAESAEKFEMKNCDTQTSKPATNITKTKQVIQTNKSNNNVYATETIKKHKKKRICLICCHCTQHHCCKCSYQSGRKQEKRSMQENTTQYESTKESPKPLNPTKDDKQSMKDYTKYTPLNIIGRYPLEKLLYCDFSSNFAMSPQKYLKLFNTRSDIMDKLHRLKTEENFSSPVTGEVYNLTPLKVDNFGVKPRILPDPIDVTDDIKHLENLEKGFQTDRESRIMLDAVCDAILSNNRCHTTSSTILNEITYSFKEHEPHTINQMVNTEDKYELPKFKKPILDETNYFNILNDNSDYCNDTILNSFSNNENQEEHNAKHEHKTNIDDMIESLMLSYETTPEKAGLREVVHNNQHKWPHRIVPDVACAQDATKPSIRLYDEYASLLLSNQGYINEKPKELYNSDILNTNINDIFNKIEEIIIKSRINDDEIQNVLNTIPKRKSCHLSSEELIHKNYLDDFNFINPLRESTSLAFQNSKNIFSDISQQNGTNQIENVKDTYKPKKNSYTEPFEDNEQKMLPAKKRKKNSKLSLPLVKKIDKYKSNKRK